MSFDLSDYVDVAERIREFIAKYPEGSLQSELVFKESGWLCKAYAYRSADDERPGIGHAFEPVPGKTPYTRDSEAMNAETSAWGRAIVALGFETKKIASAEEVRARQPDGNGGPERITDAAYQAYLEATEKAMQPGAKASEVVIHFGKNKGTALGDLTPRQLSWYANEWKLQGEPSEYDHRLKEAAIALHGGENSLPAPDPYADVPF